MNEQSKILWQCRRGMKELDLILENYLATDYLRADTAEKAHFSELLQLEDDELLVALLNGDWRGNGVQT